mgnify:FL=1
MSKVYIPPNTWKPIGVDAIENNADEVVRSNTHYSVIAGPGSGKTELLAQRACYLLQTGLCPSPYRILAISFKKDAATNLKERVAQRCSKEDALRFDSLTFDAFAKGMLDRFMRALPDIWQPTKDYELYFPKSAEYEAFLISFSNQTKNANIKSILQNTKAATFEKEWILSSPLPPEGIQKQYFKSFIVEKWWEACLKVGEKSRLTFPMICRLVELLLKTNPKICHALRATYSYVFMDEFQDTTHVQYDLVKTAFLDSSTILTAVGDNKQTIMRWAMALDDAFGTFKGDFNAKSIQLFSNYRSSPQLVAIQHYLARTIDVNYKQVESKSECRISEDACVIWDFKTRKEEAEHLAKTVLSGINNSNLAPKDFVILVKQLPEKYEQNLKEAFQKHELKVRVIKQDILTEPLTKIIVAFLRFFSKQRGGKYWSQCFNIVTSLRGISSENNILCKRVREELGELHSSLINKVNCLSIDEIYISSLLKNIEDFLGKEAIKYTYPEYQQGNGYDDLFQEIIKQLLQSSQIANYTNWDLILDDFEGLDSVSIMTIHKSKGLEYHTVIFVGLDDTAWWSFNNQKQESLSSFFVAFSRAKQRVIFTYCEARGKGRDNISSLYELLRDAGVNTEKIEVAIEEEEDSWILDLLDSLGLA